MKPTRRWIRGILPAVTVAAAGAIACVAPATSKTARAPAPPTVAATEGPAEDPVALVEAHNRVRAARHLTPLTVSGPLEAAAQEHARDMARRRRMSHRGGDGSSPFRRMADQGYNFQGAAENVAAGQRTAEEVMDGWMRSPGHRRNILGNYREIGVARASDIDGTTYWCVTLGKPAARE